MKTSLYSKVLFFDTLRDIVVSQPYVILHVDEVNSLVNKIDTLSQGTNARSPDHVYDFRRAVENAQRDMYFPVIVLPSTKYETTLSFLQ